MSSFSDWKSCHSFVLSLCHPCRLLRRLTSPTCGLCSRPCSTPSAWCTAAASTTTPAPGSSSSSRWQHSLPLCNNFQFYLKETCNLLIEMARGYLDPSSIFQIEVKFTLFYEVIHDVINKVWWSNKTVNCVREIYYDCLPIVEYFESEKFYKLIKVIN